MWVEVCSLIRSSGHRTSPRPLCKEPQGECQRSHRGDQARDYDPNRMTLLSDSGQSLRNGHKGLTMLISCWSYNVYVYPIGFGCDDFSSDKNGAIIVSGAVNSLWLAQSLNPHNLLHPIISCLADGLFVEIGNRHATCSENTCQPPLIMRLLVCMIPRLPFVPYGPKDAVYTVVSD